MHVMLVLRHLAGEAAGVGPHTARRQPPGPCAGSICQEFNVEVVVCPSASFRATTLASLLSARLPYFPSPYPRPTAAAGGRSVLTTIHQPSSRLFQQMDKLLLLSQARLACTGCLPMHAAPSSISCLQDACM